MRAIRNRTQALRARASLFSVIIFFALLVGSGPAFAERHCETDANGDCKSVEPVEEQRDEPKPEPEPEPEPEPDSEPEPERVVQEPVDDGKTETNPDKSDPQTDSNSITTDEVDPVRGADPVEETSGVDEKLSDVSSNQECETGPGGKCKENGVLDRELSTGGEEVVGEESVPSEKSETSKSVIKIDGRSVEVVETTTEVVGEDGKVEQIKRQEFFDLESGETFVVSRAVSNDTLSPSGILETFSEADKAELRRAVLSGSATDEQERLIATLSDEEKDALLGPESFADQATRVLSAGSANSFVAAALFAPAESLEIGATGEPDVIEQFSPFANAKSAQAAGQVIASAAAVSTIAAGAGVAGAALSAAGAGLSSAAGSFASGLQSAPGAGIGGANPGLGGGGPTAPGGPGAPQGPGTPARGAGRSSAPAVTDNFSGPDLRGPGVVSDAGSTEAGSSGVGGNGGNGEPTASEFRDVSEDALDAATSADFDSRGQRAGGTTGGSQAGPGSGGGQGRSGSSQSGTGAGGGGQALQDDVGIADGSSGLLGTRRSRGPQSIGRRAREFIGSLFQRRISQLPLLLRVGNDSQYLRILLRRAYILFPLTGVILGGVGALTNDLGVMQPPVSVMLALICLGALDAASGLLGGITFFLLSIQLFDPILLSDWRTVMGLLLAMSAPALMTRSIREFRPSMRPTRSHLFPLLGSALVAALIAGWLASLLVRALPSLSGLTLPIASYTGSVHMFVSGILLLRVGAEVVAARRGDTPASIWDQEISAPRLDRAGIIWLVFRFGLFVLLAGSFMPTWESALVAGALMVIPQVLSRAERILPQSKTLWRLMPFGLFAFATILVLEVVLEASLVVLYGESSKFSMIFVLSLLPMVAVYTALQLFARHDERFGQHWWEKLPVAVRQFGGWFTVLVLALAMQLL